MTIYERNSYGSMMEHYDMLPREIRDALKDVVAGPEDVHSIVISWHYDEMDDIQSQLKFLTARDARYHKEDFDVKLTGRITQNTHSWTDWNSW